MSARRLFVGALVAAAWIALGSGRAMADAAEGKKMFDAKKCIACHSLGDQKGPMAKVGGPLDGVGSKRDAQWLRAYLTDPKSKIPNAKMPKKPYTAQEMQGLIDYMLTLK